MTSAKFRKQLKDRWRSYSKDGASKHLDIHSVSHLATFLDKDGPVFKLLLLACVRETLRDYRPPALGSASSWKKLALSLLG